MPAETSVSRADAWLIPATVSATLTTKRLKAAPRRPISSLRASSTRAVRSPSAISSIRRRSASRGATTRRATNSVATPARAMVTIAPTRIVVRRESAPARIALSGISTTTVQFCPSPTRTGAATSTTGPAEPSTVRWAASPVLTASAATSAAGPSGASPATSADRLLATTVPPSETRSA